MKNLTTTVSLYNQEPSTSHGMTFPKAFLFSTIHFLPFPIPVSADLESSMKHLRSKEPDSMVGIFASETIPLILRVLGWILVPIGATAFAGLLKRR